MWKHEADLVQAYPALRQKIALLSVMEMVFRCSARDRGLAFADIAAAAHVPIDDVWCLAYLSC